MKLKKINYHWMDKPRYPILSGGMGAGISLEDLVVAVDKAGGMGTLSSVALDQINSLRYDEELDQARGVQRSVEDTIKRGGFAAANIMRKLPKSYEPSIKGAVLGGANMIVVGAGVPDQLPELVEQYAETKNHGIAVVPIVSSAQILDLIINRVWKGKYMPDAVILEGPKAGGHIGWSYKRVKKSGENFLTDYDLFDKLLGPVLEITQQYGIPVFVAGGIRTKADVDKAIRLGAAGVQIGSPLVATYESGASDDFKESIIKSSNEDVLLGDDGWGSPAGYPFRYLKDSPLAKVETESKYFCICPGLVEATSIDIEAKDGNCPEGYVREPGKACPAAGNAIYKSIYTSGTEINGITKMRHAGDVIRELAGHGQLNRFLHRMAYHMQPH